MLATSPLHWLSPARLLSIPGVGFSSSRSFSSSSIAQAGYKLKSHQGAKKRWHAIASGKFKRAQAGHHHLNVTKSAGRKNRLGNTAYSNATQTAKLKKLLPWA